MDVTPVKAPKTSPPAKNKPYVAVSDTKGNEQWLLVTTDADDGITDADFDFDKGKKWAAEQRKKTDGGK